MYSVPNYNIVRRIQYLGLLISIIALFLYLPQVDLKQYVNPTISSKFIVFSYSLVFVFSFYLLDFFLSKQSTFMISKLDLVLFILLLYISLNRYFLQNIYGFSIRYLELLGLAVLYIVLRSFPLRVFIWLFLVLILSGVIQAIYGNLQLLGYYASNHSGFKMTGSFFNPGPYAGFLALVWTLSLGMYLFIGKIKEQSQLLINYNPTFLNKTLVNLLEYIPLIGIVSIALVIPATQSRGACLAVIVSSLVLFEFKYDYIKKSLKKISHTKKALFLILAISIFCSGLFGIYHFKKDSSDGRLFIWKVTSEIIKDFPLTGIGFDRFKSQYMNYQVNYFNEYGETIEALVADNTYYAFNEWLQYIAENGFIGLLFLALFLYVFFKIRINKKDKYLYLIVKGSVIGSAIFAFFSYPLQILPFKVVLVILIALLANLDTKKYFIFDFNLNPKSYITILLKISFIVLVSIGFTKSIIYVKDIDSSFKIWKNALTAYKYGDYEGAIEKYAEVYPVLKKEGDFLMNYGKALSMANQNENGVEILKEAKQHLNTTIIESALGDVYKGIKEYDKAEIAYQRAANMIPVRFYPLYLQAKLYEETGENKKAMAMAKTILNKNIKVPSTAIKEIKAEMKKILTKKTSGL